MLMSPNEPTDANDGMGGGTDDRDDGTVDRNGDAGEADPRAAVRAALREIRREGQKAAFVYAAADAALAAAVVTFLGTVFALGGEVALPVVGTVGTITVAAIAAGGLVLAAEFGVRVRAYSAERFEAVNPAVETALRTARDASAGGETTEMARVLYADVLDRLRSASSAGLVDVRRVGVTLALALVLSFGTIHAVVAGVGVGGTATGDAGEAPAGDGDPVAIGTPTTTPDATLLSGDAVLGEATNVTNRSEALAANVSTEGGPGDAGGSDRRYATGGLPSGTSGVDARRAGFAADEDVENADIIREYNLRIRGEDDE